MKSLIAIAIIFLFSIQGQTQSKVLFSSGNGSSYSHGSGRIDFETEFFLAVKSKCKASVMSYRCERGLTFDENKITGWKKDSIFENYYVHTENVEPDLFQTHEDKRLAFLKSACLSGHFEAFEIREIFTCAENMTKEEITFEIHEPDRTTQNRLEERMHLVCDAKGGAEWLKQIYPKATWTEAPKLPHFYITKAASKQQAKELGDAIHQSTKNPPPGCRYMNCPIGAIVPDGCERENP